MGYVGVCGVCWGVCGICRGVWVGVYLLLLLLLLKYSSSLKFEQSEEGLFSKDLFLYRFL